MKEKNIEKPKLNRILKGSRVAEIDSRAISEGIDPLELMNNAGEGIFRKIFQDYLGGHTHNKP